MKGNTRLDKDLGKWIIEIEIEDGEIIPVGKIVNKEIELFEYSKWDTEEEAKAWMKSKGIEEIDKLVVVDIELKNGFGTLRNCSVFKTPQKGEHAIQNEEELREHLDNAVGYIYIQSSSINATVVKDSIVKYEIKKIVEKEFRQ